jgi:arsenate reductase (glutaredoxin)
MQDITIYHNPRCSKSRAALALLQQQPCKLSIVDYQKNPPSKSQLESILKLLGIPTRALLRKKETLYQELDLSDKTLTDQQLIAFMTEHPKLIERPIIIGKDSAIVARPPELVLDFLSS